LDENLLEVPLGGRNVVWWLALTGILLTIRCAAATRMGWGGLGWEGGSGWLSSHCAVSRSVCQSVSQSVRGESQVS
jgi:hypothetical protein